MEQGIGYRNPPLKGPVHEKSSRVMLPSTYPYRREIRKKVGPETLDSRKFGLIARTVRLTLDDFTWTTPLKTVLAEAVFDTHPKDSLVKSRLPVVLGLRQSTQPTALEQNPK